jgi:5-methylcytosine-specific restriction endonuclease McrA
VKTLLLDKMYRPIAFLPFHRMVRLVMTNKVDIISEWENVFMYKGMLYPAIIILKSYIRKKPLVPRFNFRGIFRRDTFHCQYSGAILPSSQLTVDHIIPKARGGKSTWDNCVTASLAINAAKGNRTPEEAGLKLIRKPVAPTDSLALEFSVISDPHPDWGTYFPGVKSEAAGIRAELDKVAS